MPTLTIGVTSYGEADRQTDPKCNASINKSFHNQRKWLKLWDRKKL